MVAPKFRIGDRVRIAAEHWREDLRNRVGVVADPGDHLRKHKPRWPATYWKTAPAPGARVAIVYWIDFGCAGSVPGELSAAQVDEHYLVLEPT